MSIPEANVLHKVRQWLDFADEDLRRAVAEEEEKARTMGIQGVPFFIFNNRLAVEGAQPPEVLLEAMLEAEKESAAA